MKASTLVSAVLVLFGSFTPTHAWARSGKLIRTFAELKKITVGPFDNYQSSVADDESQLYFTRGQNLSSQIIKLDLKTGKQAAVTPPETDAKNPALSPDGTLLAFTYFGNDAKGDICLLGIDQNIKCITGPGQGEHSVFWISNDKLGYIQSNDRGTDHKLFFYELKTKSSTLVTSGQISGPSYSPKTNMIVYKSQSPEFILLNPSTKTEARRISVGLPGTSGAARFSKDGDYLYFSQFILDSNRDQVLDSRDAAAIFRIKIGDTNSLPEQLTSIDQNCSYPTPATTKIYITCAFEGSLDVYSAPLDGIVPTNWKSVDLWEAHQAARTYSDKILLLNQIATRSAELKNEQFAERAFNNFVLMHAWMPAIYYANLLRSNSPDYNVHIVLLETLTKWDALPSKENVAELSRLLDAQTQKLKDLPSSPLKQIAEAHIEFFRHHEDLALDLAVKARPSDPMAIYWQTKLLERILDKKPGNPYLDILLARVANNELSEETRFYYLSRILGRLEDDSMRESKLSEIETKLTNSSDPSSGNLLELARHEIQLLKLAKAQNSTESRTHMREVVERVKKLKNEYFATRLLFARSLIVLNTANRPRELSQIMSLWLSYSNPASKEYPYAIEALRRNSLDAAYKFYNGPRETREMAKGSFYDSIRTTDDLESHYQYAIMNSQKAAWDDLTKSYNVMIKDGLIEPDSLKFVNAVHDIIGGTSPASPAMLSGAAEKIENISDNSVGVGAKYLFLGYLYHQQLILSLNGFHFDIDLADRAHRSYMYAIDAAWNNERIQAAAYQNLGLLHFRLRNYSMAAEFFQKRHDMGFESITHQEAVLWFEGRSLYQSYRPNDALQVMDQAVALDTTNKRALMEKQAFYAWNAGQFDRSAKLYAELIQQLEEKAHSGIYLSYGFALMKVGNLQKAEETLNQALKKAQHESSTKRLGLTRSPAKIEFTAAGLLARLQLQPGMRIKYLQYRLSLFEKMIDGASSYYLDAGTLRAQQVKEHFDLALLQAGVEDKKSESLSSVEKSLELANKFGQDFGYLNQTIFATLKNSMILTRKLNALDRKNLKKLVAELISRTEKAFAEEKTPSSHLRKTWAEVQIVELAYRLGSDNAFVNRFKEESDKILSGPNLTALSKDRQDLFVEIKSYRDGVAKSEGNDLNAPL